MPGAQEERLEVADSAALKPVFYICHTVTRASPLWGKGREELLAERGLLALTVVATDDQVRVQGFVLHYQGLCCWPSAGRPRSLWSLSTTRCGCRVMPQRPACFRKADKRR